MTETSEKVLTIAASMLILLSVIGLVVLAFFSFNSKVSGDAAELTDISESMVNSYYNQYDATSIKGLDVIKAIENYTDLAIVVKNGTNSYYYNKGVNITTNPGVTQVMVNGSLQSTEINRAIGEYAVQTLGSAKNYTNKRDSAYISSYANYYSYLIIDTNKEVMGYLFMSK